MRSHSKLIDWELAPHLRQITVDFVNTQSPTLSGDKMTRKRPPSKKTYKIGRDAKTGKLIPVKHARKFPNTTVVETIKK